MDYSYLNIDQKNIPKEIWKPIPEFEGYYEVSNMGRVRSLDRVVDHPRLYKQFVKGRILKQSVSYNKNKVSKIPMVDLRVSLAMEGNQYYFNTRRLVYSAFVRRINYADDSVIIAHKDCDGFNCRLSNLISIDISQKQKRVFQRERIINYLKVADRSKWTKPYGGASRRKPIAQLKNGFQIAKYTSITEASKKTGYGEKEIIGVAKGRYKKWDGYTWQYL
jgi:NUMOD4 motif